MKKKENYNYFDEFVKISDFILESSKILKETLRDFSKDKLEENILKVHSMENEADTKLHHMRSYLIKDFLPPIDREDIILIANRLDDVEDDIDEILKNFSILNINELKEEVNDFTDLVIKCSNSLKDALKEFKNFKKIDLIKEKVIELNILEDEGDKLYENAMRKLYEKSIDAIEIIKWTTIFNCFEDTIDSCEHVADAIEDVIIQNS